MDKVTIQSTFLSNIVTICITNSNSTYAQGTIYHPGDEADLSAQYVDGKKDN